MPYVPCASLVVRAFVFSFRGVRAAKAPAVDVSNFLAGTKKKIVNVCVSAVPTDHKHGTIWTVTGLRRQDILKM